jgi:hypothetical protein
MALNTGVINFISHISWETPVTDHHLVAVKFRDRLSVNKQATQTFGIERFDVVNLNDAEIEEQHLHKVFIRFAA